MRLLLAGVAAACLLAAQADRPVPRADRNSQLAHEQLLAKAKQGRIDVYFEGDSITRRWGATDYPQLLENWKKNLFGWNAADFGWGADRIENILWRLDNGELDGVNPKVIVLLAGTNNVGNRVPAAGADSVVEDVTKGLQAVLRAMQSKAPDATIVLMGIFPRNDNMDVIPEIDRINANLAHLADGRGVRYLNINDRFADGEGRLREGVMNANDKLHPTVRGYQLWADALKPLLTELLGPPSKEDRAPAPTGDPSAGRVIRGAEGFIRPARMCLSCVGESISIDAGVSEKFAIPGLVDALSLRMKNILVILGTRPEAIKLSPVILELGRTDGFQVRSCATGQHRRMLDQALEAFGIVPDHDLDIMRPDQSPAEAAARILAALDPVLERELPDMVLVQGDTITTLCGALAAFYRRVPVGHVEAGLRTGDMRQPFPEEMNRVVT
ncbi:MAG: UDP-N-acetylglucosamine 2-epimerase, partial [Bryobacteraceae bacterium]